MESVNDEVVELALPVTYLGAADAAEPALAA